MRACQCLSDSSWNRQPRWTGHLVGGLALTVGWSRCRSDSATSIRAASQCSRPSARSNTEASGRRAVTTCGLGLRRSRFAKCLQLGIGLDCAGWEGDALRLSARDRRIGPSPQERRCRPDRVTQPGLRRANVPSRLLRQCLRRLTVDMRATLAFLAWLAETLTDAVHSDGSRDGNAKPEEASVCEPANPWIARSCT